MNTLATSRLRVVVLAGVLLVAVAGLGVTTLSRHSSSNNSVPATALPQPTKHATTPSTPTTKPTTHPATTPKHTTKPTRPSVPAKPRLASSLPAPLARALAHHRVVVVAVGLGGSAVDAQARGEAKVGATLAGSGFLAVNVAKEHDAKTFESILKDDLDAPAVLVVTRPGKVFVRLDGFADRELVAQAAANAGS
jgi:hypothetical protein